GLLLPRGHHRPHRRVRREGPVPALTMEPVVIVVGAVAEALAWTVVVRGRRNIWRTLLPVLELMGAAALLTGSVRTSPRVMLATAAAVGVAAGGMLYLATRVFVRAVRGW